jgi:hypothetical protein
LNTAIVPPKWKVACVAPVYKGKYNIYEKGNYRPISVFAHIAKIFETQVQKQFLTHLLDNDYISIDQSAYRKFYSTQTALHRVTDDWLDNICDGLFTGFVA